MKKGKFIKTIAVLCIMCIAAMPVLSDAVLPEVQENSCSTLMTTAEIAEVSGGVWMFIAAILAIDAGLIGIMWATYMSASSGCSCGGCGCGC